MSAVRIAPADHVDGDVTVPGDKSISHRALLYKIKENGLDKAS